jgi:2-isopropylmalate synthase
MNDHSLKHDTRGDERGDRPSDGHARPRLIHEWDDPDPVLSPPQVLDETLRDGLQSPSVRDPSIDQKIALLHLMASIGMNAASIGLPGAHARQCDDALALATEIAREKLAIMPYCAARTLVKDIEPVVDISQRAGIRLGVGVFIGSSPIRQYAENWTLDDLKRRTEQSLRFAVDHGLSVMYVTEDTTRSAPETLAELYRTAIHCGADRLCIADTVGHATPPAAAKLVAFVKRLIEESGADIGLDWHGHRDRGLAVANSLAAWTAGADRCHGTALGIGERCGNTPIELLLANLEVLGWSHHRLSFLMKYVHTAEQALGITASPDQPVVGKNAFRTVTGIHASAVLKAKRRGDDWLADRVYSSIPAAMVGRKQEIDVGHLSGEANVRSFFEERGLAHDAMKIREVVAMAKAQRVVLTDKSLRDATSFCSAERE